MDLASRLDAALTRRLYPYSRTGAKQLAHALLISDDTLWRYRTGRTALPAETMLAMAAFFRAQGDCGFEVELQAVELASSSESWQVERLPIDALRRASAQFAALTLEGGDLLSAAANMGASLFRVDGPEVVCLDIGVSAGMRSANRRALIGRALRRWPDRVYGALISEHVLEASRGAPTYYALAGTVHGIQVSYRRALFVLPDGFVASLSERRAA